MTRAGIAPKLTRVLLNLDLSNRAALLKQREEARRVLEIIELALKGCPDDFSPNGELFTVAHQASAAPREDIKSALFYALPASFTIKDVLAGAPGMLNFNRDKAKHLIGKWKSDGMIDLERKGVGGQPSVYKKDTLAGG